MEIYKSLIDNQLYNEKEIEEMILNSDTLTSDNWEKEYQKIIDNLELELINEN